MIEIINELEEKKVKKEVINNVKKLLYHFDTTMGLYAIDSNPSAVTYEWIKENSFKIT